MPKKSIREMNDTERRFYALSAHIFHTIMICCMVLALVAQIIGLGFYTYAMYDQHVELAFSTAHHAAMSIDLNEDADPAALADQVLEQYREHTAAGSKKTETEGYRSSLAQFTELPEYGAIRHVLREFCDTRGVSDVYLAMYDRAAGAIVYIVDPDEDPETMRLPGQWDRVSSDEMDTFLDWDGQGTLYDVRKIKGSGWLCTAGVPVKDDSGRTAAFVMADVSLANIAQHMRIFALQLLIGAFFAAFIVAALVVRHMRRTVIDPINTISDAAQRYIDDEGGESSPAGYFADLDIHTGDEIENLSFVLADMEKKAQESVADLTRVTAEKERISTELDLATRIQAAMLPSTFPAFPDRTEFDIYATMDPAKEVGGDFYDFFMIDDDHLAMVIADVSGKGIPAALFMMTTRTMLKDAALAGLDPAGILYRVNEQICEGNRYSMFVTVWLGILEISTGKLIWADAGHEKPAYYHDGRWSLLEKHNGVAVGAFEPEILDQDEDPAFADQEMILSPGDAIFQYTDGVTEAMTDERQQFGEERMMKALTGASSSKPEVILPYVRKKIDSFVDGANQFDDITMLAFRYLGPDRRGSK